MPEIVRIPFHDGEVLAVDHDGKPYVVLRTAFESIGLDADQQIRKLKKQPWATTVVTTGVAEDGKTRDMVTADLRTFLMALATIPATRVAADVRPKLIAYQNEVADVIEAYWTQGGAINPRATDDQLAAIIGRAEQQMQVLRLAEGLVNRAWLEAKVRHTVARALGEEPEVDPATRPLTVGEYLAEQGMTGHALRSFSTTFGKRVKALYRRQHGTDPMPVERFVDGALRQVAGYTEADRPLFDTAWSALAGNRAA